MDTVNPPITKIAFAHIYPEFHRSRIFDQAWAARFYGAGGLPYFAEIAGQKGYQVVTADEALDHIRQGYWTPESVGLVQDLDAPLGKELLQLGVKPLMITCLEAPMYAVPFYELLTFWAEPFPVRLMYQGCFSHLGKPLEKPGAQNISVRFPALYSDECVMDWRPWAERKPMVIVLGNKYFQSKQRRSLSFWKKKNRLKAQLNRSDTWKDVLQTELHTARLDTMHHFLNQGWLDVYGSGWDRLDNLPIQFQNKLKPLLQKGYQGRCENKILTMAQYRFGLCLENQRYPGYITEKLIHCLAAGVVPVYWGAPDVANWIPENCYVDRAQFDSLEALTRHLEGITESQAKEMAASGQAYLASPEGQRHFYPNFAQHLWDCLALS